jgi:ankyrin repeat protein
LVVSERRKVGAGPPRVQDRQSGFEDNGCLDVVLALDLWSIWDTAVLAAYCGCLRISIQSFPLCSKRNRRPSGCASPEPSICPLRREQTQAMNELQRHPLNAKVATSRTVQLATEMIASGEVNGLHYLLRKSSPADVIPPGSLSITALNGHKRMTTFLIDQGVSVDEAGELGLPLRCASINGHNNICNILLSRGANIDENGPFGSALHAASMRGHLHTAKLLLDMGADANIRGGYYGTPLQAAAYHGHTELVQLLLAAKADVHAAGFSKDALHAAAEGGRHGVVQLFLDAGFQPAVQIIFGGQVASHQMRPRPNILRDSSPARRRSKAAPDPVAAVDPLDPAEGVPAYLAVGKKHSEWDDMLEAASALGHRDVVAFLLADGRCAFKEDALQFALATACRHGRFDAVEEITSGKHQLDLDLHEALHEATAGGHNGIVRTLLDSLVERGTSATLTSFETILIASMPDNPDIFAETLQRMKQVLSQSDAQGVLSECLPEAAKADCAETVSAIIAELPMITPDSLMNTFKRACDVGSSAAASVIFDQTPVTTPQLVRRIRAAAADEYEDLLQFLLDKCVGADLETYIDGIIYLAAGDGSLGVMALLLTWSSKWQLTTTATLDTALALGARMDMRKSANSSCLKVLVQCIACNCMTDPTWCSRDGGFVRPEKFPKLVSLRIEVQIGAQALAGQSQTMTVTMILSALPVFSHWNLKT